MSRKGNLNRYYVRVYPEKTKEIGKTCYTFYVSATNKSYAIKQAGNLAFKLGIEARQISVCGLVIPKSRKRWKMMIDDYIKDRVEYLRLKKLKPRDETKIIIPSF